MPWWLLILAVAAIGSYAAGYVRGHEPYLTLTAELATRAEGKRVQRERLNTDRKDARAADRNYFAGLTPKVIDEIAHAPPRTDSVDCRVPVGLLNGGIDRASAAGRVHAAAGAPDQTPRPGRAE